MQAAALFVVTNSDILGPARAERHCNRAACSSAMGTAGAEIQGLKLQPGWAPVG